MNKKINYPIRRVFILDELAIIIALAASLVLRHHDRFLDWRTFAGGLYISFGLTVCLFHVIVFLLYDNRKDSIFEQDPVENLLTVIKSRCILMALSLLYLYAIQASKRASRTIIGLFFILSILLDYAFRMLYRRHHLKKHGQLYTLRTLTIKAPYPSDEDFLKQVNETKYDEVLICGCASDPEGQKRLVAAAEKAGVRVFCTVDSMGYTVRPGVISDIGDYAAVPATVRAEKFELFGVRYSIARTEEAVLHVMRHVKELAGEYICFSNVHTSVMARESSSYADVLNSSAFTFPDGNPVAILQRKSGIYGAERVAGPDFMEHMFKNTMDGSITHYFYGASQETLDALKVNLEKNYPGIVVKGYYSPPFRELTPEEDEADVEMINASGADIIWIGLGAPKQEKWMNAHKGRVNGVMMGVGAGFDFHAGTIKRAPVWIQKIGLEWLYRLFQDPGRLIKRYLITNIKFVWYLGIDNLTGRL